MKFLYSWCHLLEDNDWNCKIGLDWYRHKCLNSKRFPGWKGLTLVVYLIWWRFDFTWVDNYANYENRMNYRSTAKLRERIESKGKE